MARGQLVDKAHNVVGIDPGITTGFSWVRAFEMKMCCKAIGNWNLAGKRHEGGGMQIVRLGRHLEVLLERITNPHLVFEDVQFHGQRRKDGEVVMSGIAAAHMYGEIVGKVKEVCELRGVPYTAMNGSHAAKVAFGFGRMSKLQVKEALEKQFERKFETSKTFDDTDALKFAVALVREFGWAEAA